MFGLVLLPTRTIAMPSIGKINHSHIFMNCMHSMMVITQKVELAMVWTIMQKKSKNTSAPSTQQANVTDAYQSPSPTWAAQCESGLQFHFNEDVDERNLDPSLEHIHSSLQHMKAPPSSTPSPLQAHECGRGKKQKAKSASPDEGFHEKYLKLKREEIDHFVAIEERKLEDPYNINKCIVGHTISPLCRRMKLCRTQQATDISTCLLTG